jgi:hypothetical protein
MASVTTMALATSASRLKSLIGLMKQNIAGRCRNDTTMNGDRSKRKEKEMNKKRRSMTPMHWLSGMKRIKACQAAIKQEAYIDNHDYSGYENGEKVKQADRAYLKELKKVAGMI